MNAKCILRLFSYSLVSVLNFMSVANAQGYLTITNENITNTIPYNGQGTTVDVIKILFINHTKKEGKLYKLFPYETSSYQTMPLGTYGNVTASITFKEGHKISTFCLEDKENHLHVVDGTRVKINLTYEDNKVTCTLTSSTKSGPAR